MTEPADLVHRVEPVPDTDRLDAALRLLAHARPPIVLSPMQAEMLRFTLAADRARVAQVLRTLAIAFEGVTEAARKLAAETERRQGFGEFVRVYLDEIRQGLPCPPPPSQLAEQMEAALRARQTRHTGPPLGRRRAPRTLGPNVRAGRPGW